VATTEHRVVAHDVRSDLSIGNVVLPSQLMRYQSAAIGVKQPPVAPVTTTTVVPTTVTPTTVAAASTPAASSSVETAAATPEVAPVVTTPPQPVVAAASLHGQATWYAAAPPGRCASPTLPFGTVLTVTDDATGVSITCTVDDREQAGYPRVVDLSPSGFSQLADTSQGVVDVTISW
jgi:rare lipoprotein A (peptidoglycan hydrolase)